MTKPLKIDPAKMMKFYKMGYNDSKIGENVGCTSRWVLKWRKCNNLPPNWGNSLDENIVKLYEIGYTDEGVSKLTGHNISKLMNFIYLHNIKLENYSDNRSKLFFELYQIGYDDIEISSQVGCSARTVKKWRNSNKLQPNKVLLDNHSLKEPESLYCDGEFLEKIIHKELKKSN